MNKYAWSIFGMHKKYKCALFVKPWEIWSFGGFNIKEKYVPLKRTVESNSKHWDCQCKFWEWLLTLRKYHKIQELKCKYITFAGITRYFTTSDTVNTFLMTVKLCSKFRAASSESVAKFTWILWVSSPIFSGVVLFSQSETIFNLKRMNLSIIYTFFLFFCCSCFHLWRK